jgi:predicted nucleotidyltransferase/DNA-binding HxlR family transcriptional regulator
MRTHRNPAASQRTERPAARPRAPSPAASVASVLFGKSMQAILALLYGRPDEEFYLRELARASDTTPSSLQRDLAALARAGIVVRTARGHQVYFRANRACPVFDELRGLVVKTFGVAEILKEALRPLVHRIDVAFVYGSVARGEERAGSDIDLLVVGEAGFGELIEALAPAQRRLAREINPTIFPRGEFALKVRAGNHFLATVLKEAKLFLIGGEDELESLARQGRAANAQARKKGNRRPARAGRPKSR